MHDPQQLLFFNLKYKHISQIFKWKFFLFFSGPNPQHCLYLKSRNEMKKGWQQKDPGMERTKQIKRVSLIMILIIAVIGSNQKRWKKYVNSGKSNLLGEELPISMCRISCSAVALKNLRLAVMKMYLDKLLCNICLSNKWVNHKNEWSRITFLCLKRDILLLSSWKFLSNPSSISMFTSCTSNTL